MHTQKDNNGTSQIQEFDIDALSSMLQEESLAIRKELFWHDRLGFDYNWAYTRPGKSHLNAEVRINSITDNIIKFLFISHRELFITIGNATEHLKATNMYGSITDENMNDSAANNPYRRVASTIKRMVIKIINQ